MAPIFITGIGTGVGKTLISAIVIESLQADYWKPVQAGLPSDSAWVKSMLSNQESVVHAEAYVLNLPASPHISAAEENIEISLDVIKEKMPVVNKQLIIEGAGGVMVPLNQSEFMIDLMKKLEARVIIVSDNYLGSINHSLLTASLLQEKKINVIGWIFNNEYMNYEQEISRWSNLPVLGSIKKMEQIDRAAIKRQADILAKQLKQYL